MLIGIPAILLKLKIYEGFTAEKHTSRVSYSSFYALLLSTQEAAFLTLIIAKGADKNISL